MDATRKDAEPPTDRADATKKGSAFRGSARNEKEIPPIPTLSLALCTKAHRPAAAWTRAERTRKGAASTCCTLGCACVCVVDALPCHQQQNIVSWLGSGFCWVFELVRFATTRRPDSPIRFLPLYSRYLVLYCSVSSSIALLLAGHRALCRPGERIRLSIRNLSPDSCRLTLAPWHLLPARRQCLASPPAPTHRWHLLATLDRPRRRPRHHRQRRR